MRADRLCIERRSHSSLGSGKQRKNQMVMMIMKVRISRFVKGISHIFKASNRNATDA